MWFTDKACSMGSEAVIRFALPRTNGCLLRPIYSIAYADLPLSTFQ